MKFRICLSLYGTTDEIIAFIKEEPRADLYEIRMDLSSELDPARVRKATHRPLIFTAHGKPEFLHQAEAYADFLDVEQGPAYKERTIVSVHAGEEDPVSLWQKHQKGKITKIVLETKDYKRMAALLDLNGKYSGSALCFAMGEVGRFTRVLSVFEGAPWCYASLSDRKTASGQFTMDELWNVYRVKRFEGAPEVFGILGNPVFHSRSPQFHNGKFSEKGLPWIYLPFCCEDLSSLLEHAERFHIRGFSVTHPYKEAVLPFLKERTAVVEMLQSCNTLYRKPEGWVGTNTDMEGVEKLFYKNSISLAGKTLVLLGAGASARTVAAFAAPHVKELIVLNRTREKARKLAQKYGGRWGSLDDLGSLEYDILFQTTSVGMVPGECPINPHHLRPGSLVIDALYQPKETELLKRARALGCITINGEDWFVSQAEAQFAWWQSLHGPG